MSIFPFVEHPPLSASNRCPHMSHWCYSNHYCQQQPVHANTSRHFQRVPVTHVIAGGGLCDLKTNTVVLSDTVIVGKNLLVLLECHVTKDIMHILGLLQLLFSISRKATLVVTFLTWRITLTETCCYATLSKLRPPFFFPCLQDHYIITQSRIRGIKSNFL